MTNEQVMAVRCAFADLVGAYEAYENMDMHRHDWKAHLLTIQEMEVAFPELEEISIIRMKDDTNDTNGV